MKSQTQSDKERDSFLYMIFPWLRKKVCCLTDELTRPE